MDLKCFTICRENQNSQKWWRVTRKWKKSTRKLFWDARGSSVVSLPRSTVLPSSSVLRMSLSLSLSLFSICYIFQNSFYCFAFNCCCVCELFDGLPLRVLFGWGNLQMALGWDIWREDEDGRTVWDDKASSRASPWSQQWSWYCHQASWAYQGAVPYSVICWFLPGLNIQLCVEFFEL